MTPQEVFEKYNTNTKMGFDSFQKVTYSGGHNQWITQYPKVNAVIRMLKDGYEKEEINFNWITDHFGGNVSKFVSGITQEEASKLGKRESLSWEAFIKDRTTDIDSFSEGARYMDYSDDQYEEMKNNVLFHGEWEDYRKPQALSFMTVKNIPGLINEEAITKIIS